MSDRGQDITLKGKRTSFSAYGDFGESEKKRLVYVVIIVQMSIEIHHTKTPYIEKNVVSK